jgi:hypothetical protein
MYRKINWKMYRVLCVVIMTLVISEFSIAQTPERIVGVESASSQKPTVAGHRLSGTVTMLPDNKPVKASINISSRPPAAGVKPFTLRTITDEQGRWKIDNVPDANYFVIIVPRRTILPIGAKDRQASETDSIFITQKSRVKMAGADIDDIDFQVNKGGRITGTVVMDGGEPLPARLIVVPRSTIESNNAPMQNVQVNKDGSFILVGVPNGEIFLKAVVFDKPNKYFMKNATVDGIDLLREPLRIKDGTEIKDVYIVFAKATDK